MLLVPVVAFAIASCDNGPTARAPYAGIPEGTPPNLGSAVPDPIEVLETKTNGALPAFLSKLSGPALERASVAYKGAMEHYEAFSYIPCYCGCAIYATPHDSVADCYVKDIAADGTVTFTDHGLTCSICEGVAQMTVEGISANKTLKEIRADVFAEYDYTGIWTDTPPIP